jgi:transcriptional regulator with XRE-family HTH domain
MNRFRELREKRGYSQQKLADMLYVNQTAVSQWERGLTTPTKDTLKKLCELYSVTADYLLGITDKPDRVSPPELREYGIEWVSVVKKARALGLSPEDIEKIIEIVSKHK